MATMTVARWTQAIEEHSRMLGAIEARDGKRLGSLLKEHLEHDCILELLASDI
jgi:DNA-binding GntR family transcriptional regulator